MLTFDIKKMLENATPDQIEPMTVVFSPKVPREDIDRIAADLRDLQTFYKNLGGIRLEVTITPLPDGSHRLDSVPRG